MTNKEKTSMGSIFSYFTTSASTSPPATTNQSEYIISNPLHDRHEFLTTSTLPVIPVRISTVIVEVPHDHDAPPTHQDTYESNWPLFLQRVLRLRSKQEQEHPLEQRLLRFVKEVDRLCALTSLLLKSKAYHEYRRNVKEITADLQGGLGVDLDVDEDEFKVKTDSKEVEVEMRLLPVVDLPRTKYGKPYLPAIEEFSTRKCAQDRNVDKNNDRDLMMLMLQSPCISLSHHGHTVALATMQIDQDSCLNMMKNRDPKLMSTSISGEREKGDEKADIGIMMGLDLVVVDPNPRGGFSTFLSCFESCFTQNEWQCLINTGDVGTEFRSNGSDRMLQCSEFYCRWALKEAYIKALGFGMSLDMGSFEMRMLPNDTGSRCSRFSTLLSVENEYEQKIEQQCVKTHRIEVVANGRKGKFISYEQEMMGDTQSLQYWDCALLLLENGPHKKLPPNLDNNTPLEKRGQEHECKRILAYCVGPYSHSDQRSCAQLDRISRKDFKKLLKWHNCNA